MLKKVSLILALSAILSATNLGYASADDSWTYESYLNKFRIELPEEWRNYCIIDERPFGICLRFYGKSLPGKGEQDYGLFLSCIADEEYILENTLDNVAYVGTANGKNYFYATSTDVSAEPILLYDDLKRIEAVKEYGIVEYRRIKEDYVAYGQMMPGVRDIISSFKPCETE